MGMFATDGRCVRRRIPSTAACVAAYIVLECAYEDGSLFDSVNGICPSNAHAMNNLLYQMQLGTISATGHELFDCDFVAGNFPEIPDLELDISLDGAAVGPFLRPEAFGFDHAAARRLVEERLGEERIEIIDTFLRAFIGECRRRDLMIWYTLYPFRYYGDGTPNDRILKAVNFKYGVKEWRAMRYVSKDGATWQNDGKPIIPRRLLFEQVEMEMTRKDISLLD